jgi:hypothetical protein
MKKQNNKKAYKAVALCLFLGFICWSAVLDKLAEIKSIRHEIDYVTEKIRQHNSRGDGAIYSIGAPSTPSTSPKSLIVDNGLE